MSDLVARKKAERVDLEDVLGFRFNPNRPVKKRRLCIDFEGRAKVSIFDVGGWMYSRHPDTELLCLCWSYDDTDEVFLWHPAYPAANLEEVGAELLEELWAHIAAGWEVEAHNAFFEMSMWTNICVDRLGWPSVPMDQWRCSAAKAASFNLPRALEDVCLLLNLKNKKNMTGNAAMMKCSRWKKPTKKLPGRWHEDREDLLTTFSYCADDVRAEKGLSHYLRDLPEQELRIWQMDQRMNLRGTYCDVQAARAAVDVATTLQEAYLAELAEITGDPDITPTKRVRIINWCSTQGLELENTKGDYIDSLLEDPSEEMSDDVRRVLEILRACGRTSLSKYQKMLEIADPVDNRMRDLMMYHGASTGRWTGRLVQPHNFVRGSIKDMEALWEDIILVYQGKRSPLWISAIWGDPMEVLSHATRGAIAATPGKKLWVADYAAIEARVLFWLFGEEDALKILAAGEDIYCALASEIYKRKITKKDAKERQLGKKGILGLGYQMGAPKFEGECEKDGIELPAGMAETVVNTYRNKYKKVSRGWYALNEAAIWATKLNGKGAGGEIYVDKEGRIRRRPHQAGGKDAGKNAGVVVVGKLKFAVVGRFLHMRLPSGRLLSYYAPRVGKKATPWGDMRECLTYMAQDDKTKKWFRSDTYGGKLTENAVQAIARDFMAFAMLEADNDNDVDVLLSVHDELICEADNDNERITIPSFEAMMERKPKWGATCPIKAEAFSCYRYRK